MQREHRSLKLPVKLETRDGKQRIEGYAAVFYNASDPGTEYKIYADIVERVMPTAFQEYFASANRDCRGLFNHDPSCLLGREGNGSMSLAMDARGLSYSIMPPDTQLGRDMVAYLTRGDITGSSFSFRATSVTWRELPGGVICREINSVELFDVGPVTFPAYEGTTAGMRSRDVEDVRVQADQWRRDNQPRPSLAMRRRQLRLVEAE